MRRFGHKRFYGIAKIGFFRPLKRALDKPTRLPTAYAVGYVLPRTDVRFVRGISGRNAHMNIELQSMAIEMPQVAAHPNRAPFRGVLTFVDRPSEGPPSGAKGHRVLLTRSACERALPSLLGMGLDYAPALDAHDAQRKIGVITEANIVSCHRSPVISGTGNRRLATDNCLEVSGFLYARDFPRIVRTLRATQPNPAGAEGAQRHLYGMSYEITEASVQDFDAPVWIVTDFTFTGAAILRRDKAAYRNTWFELL